MNNNWKKIENLFFNKIKQLKKIFYRERCLKMVLYISLRSEPTVLQTNSELPGSWRSSRSKIATAAFCRIHCSLWGLLKKGKHSSPSPWESPDPCKGTLLRLLFCKQRIEHSCVGLPGLRWGIGSTARSQPPLCRLGPLPLSSTPSPPPPRPLKHSLVTGAAGTLVALPHGIEAGHSLVPDQHQRSFLSGCHKCAI